MEVLKYLSLRDPDSSSESDDTEYVIGIECFHAYEISHPGPVCERAQASAYYWHQAVFEAFNEFLDESRPFGIRGQPYAWEVAHLTPQRRLHLKVLLANPGCNAPGC